MLVMYSLLFLAGTSFVIALILTPVTRDLFLRFGFVDLSDERKLHYGSIPRIGGVPIALAFLTSIAILLLLPAGGGNLARSAIPRAIPLVPAVVVIFATGMMDDIRSLKAGQKLIGQILGSCLAMWAGVEITSIAGHPISPWMGIPLTLLWLIACTNAFNLIDGVDGLATGIGLFASTTILIWALAQNRMDLALATAPLLGSLLGFLRYNFNPATVFLGDCGSLFIGFMFGCYAVLWSQKSVTVLGMAAPLMALAIPLLDTGLSVIRRFLRGQPIFEADREHIHHRLLARGFTQRGVTLILYGTCGVAAIFSVLASFLGDHFAGLLIALFCAGAWIGIHQLGYSELHIATRMLVRSSFRTRLNSHLELERFRNELWAADDLDRCWAVLCKSYKNFGFQAVSVRTPSQTFHQDDLAVKQTLYPRRTELCVVTIPLPRGAYVELKRFTSKDGSAADAISYADAISDILTNKLEAPLAIARRAAAGKLKG